MKKHFLALLTGTLIIVGIFFTRPAKILAEITPLDSRKAAPPFSLTDATHKTIQLSDYKGRVVLLNFWATWCHGCVSELPWYVEFYDKYKERGLSVIAASMDDDGWKVVNPFVQEKKLNFTVVLATDGLPEHYGLGAMPMSVLIDRQGRIADTHSGVVEKDAWENEIKQLLAEDQKPKP